MTSNTPIRVNTRADVHKCAAEGCDFQTPRHLLMCNPHWKLVPAPLQRQVWAKFRNLRQGIEAVKAYRLAVDLAVKAVKLKEDAP